MIGGVGLIQNTKKKINHLFKKEENIVILIGKTFGHLYQSAFFNEIHSVNDGPPPDINLLNERNNGEAILKLIKDDLVSSVHDVSSGGLIMALAEMSIGSNLGIKIDKPQKLLNLFEYFFGEDQGRYVIEIQKKNVDTVNHLLKENNIFNELIGCVQKDFFELKDHLKIDINELYKINNTWYHKY